MPPSHGLTGLAAIKEVANKTVFCRVQAAFERALNPVGARQKGLRSVRGAMQICCV